MKAITNTHLAKHGITTADYITQYGPLSEPRRNDELLARLSLLGIGVLPDSVMADKSGISRRGIAYYREQLGMPSVSVIYRTQEGFPCRSILEAKYDAWLHDNHIEHLHEQYVPGTSGKCRADLKIGDTFVEIAGMIAYKKYAARWKRKCEIYSALQVQWKAVYEDEVEQLYSTSQTQVIFVKRVCSQCGNDLTVSLDGMCRTCHRKVWGQKNATLVTCAFCGTEYPRTAGSKTGKFCTRKCYWTSIRLERLPSDAKLAEELNHITVPRLAEKYGVRDNTIYMRMRRMKMRKAA
jgi:hypothetical protein